MEKTELLNMLKKTYDVQKALDKQKAQQQKELEKVKTQYITDIFVKVFHKYKDYCEDLNFKEKPSLCNGDLVIELNTFNQYSWFFTLYLGGRQVGNIQTNGKEALLYNYGFCKDEYFYEAKEILMNCIGSLDDNICEVLTNYYRDRI